MFNEFNILPVFTKLQLNIYHTILDLFVVASMPSAGWPLLLFFYNLHWPSLGSEQCPKENFDITELIRCP
jgi:hypothetical protein